MPRTARLYALSFLMVTMASASPGAAQGTTPGAQPAPPVAPADPVPDTAPIPETVPVQVPEFLLNPVPVADDPAAADLAAIQASQRPVVLDPTAKAKTQVTIDRKTHVGAGLGFAGPFGAIGSLQILHGLGADIDDDGTRVKAVCAAPLPHCAQGFLLRADAGSGGGRFSLGVGAWANVSEEEFKGTAGVALRVALAHTWGNPIGQPTGVTFLGPELDLSVKRINLTLGVLFKVAGDGGSSALFSWGLGFGL